MSKKTIVLIVVLFGLLVLGMFMYANLKSNELKNEVETPSSDETPNDMLYPEITRIDAKHFFIDGVHTLAGEIALPTPCDLLETETVVMESYPEQVNINFTVINNAEICAQVVTAQRFKIDIQASEAARFSATFMGRSVDLNLIPAAEGEQPDDFELFIKG